MLISRRSPITGKINIRSIPVTEKQLADWQGGALLQNAMPHLSPSDREFIKTGITDEEWDDIFNEEEEF